MKHWSRNLEYVGKPIVWKAESIERLNSEKQQLLNKIVPIDFDIQLQEQELLNLIENDWTEEEITNARAQSSNPN